MKARCIFLATWFALALGSSARGQFVPGHVFVAEQPIKLCKLPAEFGSDRIWEIDPATGEATVFVQIPPEMCGFLTGLAFTPDGTRLRASSFLRNEILEFDSDGNMTIALDASDGILCPKGFNNLAYDAHGNFYVVNKCTRTILRFPPDGGPATVFADAADWVGAGGSIAFAADGDLYLTTFSFPLNIVVRITPDGMGSIFDSFGGIISPEGVTADKSGHVYVGLETGEVLRYKAGDPASKELLGAGFPGGRHSMTMSPDQSKIYLWSEARSIDIPRGSLKAIDVVDGTLSVLAEIPFNIFGGPAGIAVVPLPPPPIPTVSHWGVIVMILLLLTAATLVLIHRRAVLRPRSLHNRTICDRRR